MNTVVFTIGLCVLLLIPSLGFCENVDFSAHLNQLIRYTAAVLRTIKPKPGHLADDLYELGFT